MKILKAYTVLWDPPPFSLSVNSTAPWRAQPHTGLPRWVHFRYRDYFSSLGFPCSLSPSHLHLLLFVTLFPVFYSDQTWARLFIFSPAPTPIMSTAKHTNNKFDLSAELLIFLFQPILPYSTNTAERKEIKGKKVPRGSIHFCETEINKPDSLAESVKRPKTECFSSSFLPTNVINRKKPPHCEGLFSNRLRPADM